MGYAFVQTLAGEIQAAGGIVTAQDLLSAQPVVKQPITAQVCNANPTYPLCACVSDARTSLPPPPSPPPVTSMPAVVHCNSCRWSDGCTLPALFLLCRATDLLLKSY